MFASAFLMLLVALLAGVLGFGVAAGPVATIAKMFFVIGLFLFAAALLRGRRA